MKKTIGEDHKTVENVYIFDFLITCTALSLIFSEISQRFLSDISRFYNFFFFSNTNFVIVIKEWRSISGRK